MIAPYAASLDPITNAHQNVAVTFHMVVFDSFHLGATFTACKGGVSSVSEGVASGVYWYPGSSVGGQGDGLELSLLFISGGVTSKVEKVEGDSEKREIEGLYETSMEYAGKQLVNVTPIFYISGYIELSLSRKGIYKFYLIPRFQLHCLFFRFIKYIFHF